MVTTVAKDKIESREIASGELELLSIRSAEKAKPTDPYMWRVEFTVDDIHCELTLPPVVVARYATFKRAALEAGAHVSCWPVDERRGSSAQRAWDELLHEAMKAGAAK